MIRCLVFDVSSIYFFGFFLFRFHLMYLLMNWMKCFFFFSVSIWFSLLMCYYNVQFSNDFHSFFFSFLMSCDASVCTNACTHAIVCILYTFCTLDSKTILISVIWKTDSFSLFLHCVATHSISRWLSLVSIPQTYSFLITLAANQTD